MRVEGLGGPCRRCGQPSRPPTEDGGGWSSLCAVCTPIVNAERMAGIEPIPTRWTKESAAAFDKTYLHTSWADAMMLVPKLTPEP